MSDSRWGWLWESLVVVSAAVGVGALIGQYLTENDWVQVTAMLLTAPLVGWWIGAGLRWVADRMDHQ